MSELLHYFLVGLIPMLVIFGMVGLVVFWAWFSYEITGGSTILGGIIFLSPLFVFLAIICGYQIAHNT